MTKRVPRNLDLLTNAFDVPDFSQILPGDSFRIGDVEFVCSYEPNSTANQFFIIKSLPLVERYRDLSRRFKGTTIVELGIAEGGSTALMALEAEPAKLIAIDLETEPLEALTQFIEAHGLTASVRPLYGIDQSDRKVLAEAVDRELGGAPIDLVVDDCSHQLAETRSSFETLFPRLRPGGLFVIEDWNADHLMREAVAVVLREQLAEGREDLRQSLRQSLSQTPSTTERRAPLSQLAIEFVLARAASGDAVAEVIVDEFWVTVRRGPGQLDPDTFRLDDLYTDHFGLKGW